MTYVQLDYCYPQSYTQCKLVVDKHVDKVKSEWKKNLKKNLIRCTLAFWVVRQKNVSCGYFKYFKT